MGSSEPGLSARLDRIAPVACRAVAYLTGASAGGTILVQALRGSQAYVGLFADDFFYYAVMADRLVSAGRWTFDGLTATNGVHPLWFFVTVVLRLLAGGTGHAFFALLGLVIMGILVAGYEGMRLLAERLGAPPALAASLAAVQMTYLAWLATTGLEVGITAPVYAFLLAEVARDARLSARRAATIGLLTSLAVLARLDLVLGAGLLVVGWLAFARPRPEELLRTVAAFGAGGLLLPAYLLFNKIAFGAFATTSARAKQLRLHPGFNTGVFVSVFRDYTWKALPVLLGIALLVVLSRQEPRLRPAQRLAAAVALLFPMVFYVALAVESDWSFFGWYAYPLAHATVVALVLLWRWAAPRLRQPVWTQAVAGVLSVSTLLVAVRAVRSFMAEGLRWTLEDNTLASMSVQLERELRDRQGVFAMGDRGGTAAFVLGKPVVQLEGLVADAAMLDHIQRQDPLEKVIAAYGIDYVVVSQVAETLEHLEHQDGCYVVQAPTPFEAHDSAKMTGRICSDPIVHFVTPRGPHRWSRWLSLETWVFDVRDIKRRQAATP
jgi:hypothetical protein